MLDNLTISKTDPGFPEYVDFNFLREAGISYLQAYSGDIWTDYNLHDPGITILEVLSYAITDLGYRTNFDTKDLLALNPEDADAKENNFFTADQILTINPVTELDFRKRLIDIPGVRNAWLEKVNELEDPTVYIDCKRSKFSYKIPQNTNEENAILLHLKGIYDVCIQVDPILLSDACGNTYTSTEQILQEVRNVLCRYRNLCEDFRDIIILGEEEIALCTDIELTNEADPEDVLIEIFVKIQEFLSPRLTFYTLPELLAKGLSPADIYAGRPSVCLFEDDPYESHGFIDTEELAAIELREILYTSDLYKIIMDVPGVAAIKKLSIINYINGLAQSLGDAWCLHLTEKHHPIVSTDFSKITFFKGELPFKADLEEVKKRFQEQQQAYIKAPLDKFDLDLQVPKGTYFDLADHYSIHHDFPITYGIGDEGLPGHVPASRRAQAKQLKSYLLFFDQLLANYLSQLSHLRDLFSMEEPAMDAENRRTYFSQGLENVPCANEIIQNYNHCGGSARPGELPIDYIPYLQSIIENEALYTERRNRFLNHLLARFAENFTDYVLLNHQIDPTQSESSRRSEQEIIQDKSNFLRQYPLLSHDRFRAYNYCDCDAVWDTDNVSGFKKRVSSLLGISDFSRRNLHHCEIIHDEGGFQFSLKCSEELPALKSKTIYPNLQEAQAAFSAFLSFVSNPLHYKGLSHASFYHYGWEITDQEGNALAVFGEYYPSQAERNDALVSWQEFPKPPLKTDIIKINKSQEATITPYGFTLQFEDLEGSNKSYTYVSTQSYITSLAAEEAANLAFEQLFEVTNYLRRIRQGNENESGENSSETFTYYSFAVIDVEGNILAESDELRADAAERDELMFKYIACILARGMSVSVEPASECFFIEIKDKYNTETQLRSVEGCPSEAAAIQVYLQLLIVLKDKDTYQSISLEDGSFSFQVEEAGEVIFAHPFGYATEIERDLRKEALLYYLNQANPCAKIEGQEGTYQISLLDYENNVLLTSFHSYPTQKLAENACQKMLQLASDEVYFNPIDDLEGDNSYGFELQDRHDNVFATHPGAYPTACERDLAIEAIVNYVNKEIERSIFQESGKYRYALVNQKGKQLLISESLYEDELATNDAFDAMMLLAIDQGNYELLEDTTKACPFSFRLLDGEGTVIANHPDEYELESERDLALQALINCLINEDPIKKIEGTDGDYAFFLQDILFDPNIYLLTSKLSYPDKDIAANAWKEMLEYGQDRNNYVLTGAAGAWGFELWNDPATGECIAAHWDETNTSITYATEEERDAAIEKIICYLFNQQMEEAILEEKGGDPNPLDDIDTQFYICIAPPNPIQYSIVNDEGAFYPLIMDEACNLLFEGLKVFPDEEAALQHALEICEWAKVEANYQLTNTQIGKCPFTFSVDVAGEAVAKYPGFFATEEDARRKINELILKLCGPESLMKIREEFTQFAFKLEDSSGTILLNGISKENEEAAQSELDQLWIIGKVEDNFIPTGEAGSFSFEIHQDDQLFASHPAEYGTEDERDAQLQTVHRFIQTLGIPYTVAEDEGQFYFQLPDASEPIWLEGSGRYASEEEAFEVLANHIDRMRQANAYEIVFDPEPCTYEIQLKDQDNQSLAKHPLLFSAQETAESKLELWLTYLAQFPSTASIVPGEPVYYFEMCDLEDQRILVSCSSYESEAVAIEQFQLAMELAKEEANIQRIYDNDTCTFTFEIINPATNNCIAKSPVLYLTRQELEDVLGLIQAAIKPFEPIKSVRGTVCAYYIYLELDEELRGEPLCLKCISKFPSESAAWQAVGEFISHLSHKDRFISPIQDAEANEYALGIVDEEQAWQAILIGIAADDDTERTWLKPGDLTDTLDIDQLFVDLNPWDVGIFIELVGGSLPDPIPLMKDFEDRILLQTSGSFADIAAVQQYWETEILPVLAKEAAYRTIPGASGQGYSFELISIPDDPAIEPIILAEHPHDYPTEASLAEAIEQVQSIIGFQTIDLRIEQLLPAFTGRIFDQSGVTLLEGVDRIGYDCLMLGEDDPDATVEAPGLRALWLDDFATIEEYLVAIQEEIISVELYPRHSAASDTFTEGVWRDSTDFRGRSLFRYGLELKIYISEIETSLLFLSSNTFDSEEGALSEANLMIGKPALGIGENWRSLVQQDPEIKYSLVYFDPDKKEKAENTAWQRCNDISELAQDEENYRRINDDAGVCTYDFVLTNEGKDIVLAGNEGVYSSIQERDSALQHVIDTVNDEGFHVLEHILLRPRQKGIANTYFVEWEEENPQKFALCSTSAYGSEKEALAAYEQLIECVLDLPPINSSETSVFAKYDGYLKSLVKYYDTDGNVITPPSDDAQVDLKKCIVVKLEIDKEAPSADEDRICHIFDWKAVFEQWGTTSDGNTTILGAVDELYNWVGWIQELYSEGQANNDDMTDTCLEERTYPSAPETEEESMTALFPCGLQIQSNRLPNDPKLVADGFLPISTNPEECAKIDSQPCLRSSLDPYSFWVSVILPYWPSRFRDMNFRRFVERTLRLEAPAHVALKICWIDVCQMHDFEEKYKAWLENLAKEACSYEPCDRTRSLNEFLELLPELSNVYPEATLHDCEESGAEDNPIILNQTALGTANE